MTVEELVIARLASIAAVTALVGTRIYALVLPQTVTYPAIRVQRIDGFKQNTLSGWNGVTRGRIQVDVYGRQVDGADWYATVNAVADAIEGDGQHDNATGLHRWNGELGSPAIGVLGAFQIDRVPSVEFDEQRLVRVRQDYDVWAEAR